MASNVLPLYFTTRCPAPSGIQESSTAVVAGEFDSLIA